MLVQFVSYGMFKKDWNFIPIWSSPFCYQEMKTISYGVERTEYA